MPFQIIGDSCTDVTPELKSRLNIKIAPLSIMIGDYTIVDDDTFDQKDFLRRMEASPDCPKSSCPSPQAYMDLFQGEEDAYVVTLSSQLSGSFNSAMLAKRQYQEDFPDKKIAVIDSMSASVGQTLIALKIHELASNGESFEQVEKKVNQYRDEMGTKFVLESLENLRKNGRLSNIKAFICSALSIKPIMMATKEGKIDKLDQARGLDKALSKMAGIIAGDAVEPFNRSLGISHCNNYEKALYVKEQILSQISFKEVYIVDMAGISSLYANDGGIIVCY